MGCLGNVLWFVFGGAVSGLSWCLAGCLWCITVVGIPVGMQCFKFAALSFFPFGKEVQYGGGAGSFLLNIIWLIVSGLPDIPVFTGMILKNIYETALQYGYSYESREEKYFILLLIRGAVSYGDTLCEIDGKVNEFIRNGILPEEYQDKEQIEQTAGSLSKELLYMKFLQGIPVVGAVGGAYDAVYMKRITEYAELKYRHRYLAGRKKAENKLLF